MAYLATIYTPEGAERWLAPRGGLAITPYLAARFQTPGAAEAAAERALPRGGFYMIETETMFPDREGV
jgi:hypothetical protein